MNSPDLMKVASGGQTGVDRAALDAALKFGLSIGGWCPQGRKSESGVIPSRYPLTETDSPTYKTRTLLNVRDSDATLIFSPRDLSPGTELTWQEAARLGRSRLWIEPGKEPNPAEVASWLREHGVAVLNVAGPREGEAPGIYDIALDWLSSLFLFIRKTGSA